MVNKLRLEYVVAVEGLVRSRPSESVNKRMKTGTIEVKFNDYAFIGLLFLDVCYCLGWAKTLKCKHFEKACLLSIFGDDFHHEFHMFVWSLKPVFLHFPERQLVPLI